MSQNKKKLINLLAGNLANAIIHQILEEAIQDEDIAKKYFKEIKNSWEIAKTYREKINPTTKNLSKQYSEEIKKKITTKVNSELKSRITKGYTNIKLESVNEYIKKALDKLKI